MLINICLYIILNTDTTAINFLANNNTASNFLSEFDNINLTTNKNTNNNTNNNTISTNKEIIYNHQYNNNTNNSNLNYQTMELIESIDDYISIPTLQILSLESLLPIQITLYVVIGNAY